MKKFNLRKWWSKRKEHGFTLMAVSNAGGRPVHFHLPVRLLLVVFVIMIGFTGLNVYMWFAFPAQIAQIGNLYKEIETRDRTIVRLDKENKEIQPSIERSREQAKRLEQIQMLEAEAKALIDAVRKKGGRTTTTSTSRGLIVRNRLSDELKTEVQSEDGKDSRLATLDRNLDIMDKALEERHQKVKRLIADLKATEYRLDHTPSVWPLGGRITSSFGTRRDPFTGAWKTHTGVDISAKTGQQIRATAAGKVISAGWSTGYGLRIEVDHGFGYRSLYAHNSKLLVSAGQTVKKGQVICLAGSTGRSTAPHLHFEIKYLGKHVNPISAMYQ